MLRRGPGTDQVQRAKFSRSGAAHGLAIDSHVLDAQALLNRLDPTSKTCLEGVRLETIENTFKGVMRRDAVGQFQKAFQPVMPLTGKGLDVLPVLGTSNDRTQGNDNDVLQQM